MKLDFGDVRSLDGSKSSNIIAESKAPEIFGTIIGVATGLVATLIGRHLYKKGAEDAMNGENRALESIGALEAPENVYAEVLK